MKKRTVVIAILFSTVMLFSTVATDSYAAEENNAEVCEINDVNFPDENFREYVKSKFDEDLNDKLSQTEIDKAEEISVGEMNITSLKGIEYFVKVNKILCYKNNIETLDISENVALERLECYSNALEELNISANTNLKYLNCYSNKLKVLDVNNNKSLEVLILFNNQVSELKVNNNTALKQLELDVNNVSELDVSKNTELELLRCDNNHLKKLDVKNNEKLKMLFCSNNQLVALDTSNNTNLENYYGGGNQYDVEIDENNQIDLSKLPGELDVSKAYEWTNATLEGEILTVKKGASTVTYNYNIGREQTEQFTLNITNYVPEESTTETETSTDAGQDTKPDQTTEDGQEQTSDDTYESTSNQDGISKIKKPTVKKVSRVKIKSSKRKLTLLWKKNKSVSGYQIQISKNRRFKKAKIKRLSKNKNKYIFKRLKSKKRYYVRIRAYVTYKNNAGKNTKAYGKWIVKKKKVK